MKKFIVVLIAVFISLFTVNSFADQVTLAWDPNSTTPLGYAVFERNAPAGGAYDYKSQIWPTDGSNHTEVTATVNVADKVEHAFVVRAYDKIVKLDGSEEIVWSGDSNEVTYISNTPVESPQNLIVQAIQNLSEAVTNLAKALAYLPSVE